MFKYMFKINLSKIFLISYRNIIKNRARSAILAIAILLVTFILTLVMAITAGVDDNLTKTASTLMSGDLNVGGFYKISSSSAAPAVTEYTKITSLIMNDPNIKSEISKIVDRIRGYGRLISDETSMDMPLWGVDLRNENYLSKILKAHEGDFDRVIDKGNMAIFEYHARKLKVKVGDVVTLSVPTQRNTNNTKDVKVVAILKDIGFLSQFSVFLNSADLRDVYQMKENVTGVIMIYLKNLNKLKDVENKVNKLLTDNNYKLMEKDQRPFFLKFDKVSSEPWRGQKIDITTWEEEISFLRWIIKIFNALTMIFTVILLVIIAFGIMNAVMIAIKERTIEIGTLRAIGMQKIMVIKMFLLEAFLLSATASILGITLGAVVALFLNILHIPIMSEAFRSFLLSNELILSVRIDNILLSFFIVVIVTMLGAIYPSYRASKLKPIVAINHID
ncbi:MAG: ABC transporter permease [Oligoflexia bacterium]|nr:ABC transporter permease [Oligoflexia bacterium]